MKLTNLNCPQCGGQLQQERDMFFCTSCGAAFNVDYDDDDVKYTELVTEADRTKMLLAKDIEIMETRYRLREEMQQREQQREWQRTRNETVKRVGKGCGTAAATWLFSILLVVGLFVFVAYQVNKGSDEAAKKEKSDYYSLIADVKTDEIFLENAIADGANKEWIYRVDYPVTDKENDDRVAAMKGDAEIEDVYLLQNDKTKKLQLYLVYKITYAYDDGEIAKEVYDCIRIKEIEKKSDGSFKIEFFPEKVRMSSSNSTWEGYFEKDQLYRECILSESNCTVTKLDIPHAEKGDAA